MYPILDGHTDGMNRTNDGSQYTGLIMYVRIYRTRYGKAQLSSPGPKNPNSCIFPLNFSPPQGRSDHTNNSGGIQTPTSLPM